MIKIQTDGHGHRVPCGTLLREISTRRILKIRGAGPRAPPLDSPRGVLWYGTVCQKVSKKLSRCSHLKENWNVLFNRMYWLYIVEHIIRCHTPAAFTLAKWIPTVLGIPRNSSLFQDMQISKDKKSWPPYSIQMFVLQKLKGPP